MPDAFVAGLEVVELLDVVAVVELGEAVVVKDDSTGGEDDAVHADVMVASPRTTATPTRLNPRRTLHPFTHR